MLANQQSLFNIPEEITYLNCAYMSPMMTKVEEVGIEALKRKANPSSITANDFFADTEKLRTEFATLINSPEPNRCVIIPSVSYGMGNVMRNVSLEEGDNVVVIGEQFPSNYYPWHRLCAERKARLKVISADSSKSGRGKKWNEKIHDAIDNKTKLISLGHVHWADGTLFDLMEIRKRTNDVGALMVIDGTQSIGALPFDLQEFQPDALICAGYKWLMGPYSIGMAYYGPYFDEGVPIEENWINRLNSEDFAGLVSYEDQYQPGALRYEVGEHSNFNLVPMLLKAIEQINAWSPAEIQNYCADITKNELNTLEQRGFSIESPEWRGSHLFGIRLPENVEISQLKSKLAEEQINVSVRGDAVRVAPHLYNSRQDMQKLTDVLLHLK
ncbi:MAG: aminotransferase class V-fold PLP-dependent enzyme [Bacteroidota bacterium]